MNRLAAVAARLALIVFGVAVALGGVELAMRLWPAGPSDLRGLHVVRPDRAWVFGLRPGAHQRIAGLDEEYRINADGFRDREVRVPKPPGTFRIALVGDSLTFGYAVGERDTMPRQLERALGTADGAPPIDVLNLGVSGYNPYTEAALLADVAGRYTPDLVLVQFCVNDLNDPTQHFDFATRTALPDLPDVAFPDPRTRAPAPTRLEAWCAASRVCAFLRKTVWPPADELRRALQAVAIHGDPPPDELAWLGDRYDEMRRLAADVHAPFAVVVFPYQSQLLPNAPRTLQDALLRLGGARGWRVFDLLPALRDAQAAQSEPLYLDPWHPTGPGYAIAADALARALRCARMVPRAAVPGDCPVP